jgi:microcystin-dependent protein
MFRIDNSSAVSVRPTPGPPGTPGFFTNGNPATAQEATIVDDWWANSVQEEILTVIEQAGITPDKGSISQLFEALNRLYQGVGALDETYLTIINYRQWEAPHVTTGTSTAYTLFYTVPPGALMDGMVHTAEFHIANGAQPQLGVNNLGLRPVHYYSVGAWRPLPPNLVGPGENRRVAYHQASDAYRLLDWRDTTGDWVPTGRGQARLGTILGQGQAVSRANYAGLFAAYGTTYGAGNGSTTFNLPDLRGRVVAGTDQGAGRLVTSIAGTLGSFGGQEMQQYNLIGEAVSSPITGTVDVTGTAFTDGMAVAVWGTTSAAIEGGNTGADAGHSGGQSASPWHFHTFNVGGNVQGNATVQASGQLAGWTGGSALNGTTDPRSNLPPTIVGNYAIAL